MPKKAKKKGKKPTRKMVKRKKAKPKAPRPAPKPAPPTEASPPVPIQYPRSESTPAAEAVESETGATQPTAGEPPKTPTV